MDPGVPVFGDKGCSIHVQEVLRSLLKISDGVDLFTVRLGNNYIADLDRIKVHKIAELPKGDTKSRERKAISINKDLKTALKDSGSYDLVYERYSLWSYAGIKFASENHIPSIIEVNSPLIVEQENHRELIHKKDAESISKQVFNYADSLIAVSKEIKQSYITDYVDNEEKVHIVPNGVNLQK